MQEITGFRESLQKRMKLGSANTFLCQPLIQSQPWSLVTGSGSCLLDFHLAA